jgi:hypothetical protein
MAGNWCAKRSGHITNNTGSELPSLSESKEYYQKSFLMCCSRTAFKKVNITFLSGAAFGELARGAAVLKLKQMLKERLASLDFPLLHSV